MNISVCFNVRFVKSGRVVNERCHINVVMTSTDSYHSGFSFDIIYSFVILILEYNITILLSICVFLCEDKVA